MPGFQGVMQFLGIEEIVLDSVTGTGDAGLLEAPHGAHQLPLHVEGQGSGDAVGVQLIAGQALGLDEDLVGIALGEAHHLVFDGRAIARPHAFDDPGIHGRARQATADDLVGLFIGAGDETAGLFRLIFMAAHEGEHRPGLVAGLFFQHAEVHAAPVDARRRTGLEALHREGQLPQAAGQGIGGGIAGTAPFVVLQADVNPPAQEGAHGEHHRLGVELQTHLSDHAGDPVALHDQVIHSLLEDIQIGLVLQGFTHSSLVQDAIRLAAGGAHGGAFAGVEGAEVDARLVRGMGHKPPQGIHFLDQVAFADTTDGRVAAHGAQGIDVVSEQQGARAHARRGQSCLGACVSAADDDDLIGLGVKHIAILTFLCCY